jgi:hypothetical protein
VAQTAIINKRFPRADGYTHTAIGSIHYRINKWFRDGGCGYISESYFIKVVEGNIEIIDQSIKATK